MKALPLLVTVTIVASSPVLGDLVSLAFEGTCTQPPGEFDSNLDSKWLNSEPNFYITYASLQFWVQQAQICLGEEPLSLAVLAGLELKRHWDLVNASTTCFGRTFSQDCSINTNGGNPFAECRVLRADPRVNTDILADFKKRVILTDNRTFILFTRCLNGLQSYYLAKPSPTPVTLPTLKKVIEKVRTLGFDPSLLTRIQNRDVDYLPNNTYKF